MCLEIRRLKEPNLKRHYEAIIHPTKGHKMKVDFGEISLNNSLGNLVKLI